MQNQLLVIANSNVFTVLTHVFLQNHYSCSFLNVRYSNEDLTPDEHFVQQLKEIRLDRHYKKGIIRSKHEFAFTERLILRLERSIHASSPQAILYEMSSTNDAEWIFLSYIKETFPHLPLMVFVNVKKQKEQTREYLRKIGIQEIVLDYDKNNFLSLVKRNIEANT